MRAARLIKMVLLLQARASMTAAELAEELEVSERTITRDAQALSEAGVPVYADRGRTGGYRLIGGYRTRLTGLARSEAEALFLSGVPGALREMGLEDAASAARLKVSAALLPSLRDASQSASQRFHLDAPGWFQETPAPDLLPAVADAVWDDRRLIARYRRQDSEVGRELEPYGLVLKAGVWYLCARVPDSGSYRVYRIDRFTSVEPSGDDRFARDEDFDLPGFWEERAAQFARAILRDNAVLRLSPDGARQLPYVTDRAAAHEALTDAEPDERGWVTITLPVESAVVAYSQLLTLGPEVEVLGPPELRDRLAATATRMAALYR
ncbi:helix-turn-helix transcriptional regulator [Streptomyces flavofungini]|uniref:WYL domain-containing protein n=1 Tax=Streptomyces flavofungini TaxID=68200 RepID=A0ABS0X2U6_9ACTN|nr:WYL domain-containing protein [Streptomyces flavofungini]MBJ3807361.1 WYL domain-containing protein [Streptomyces flavofungini]GHC66009.1 transcriptional regulator [Streptomyces flavofungini]